MNHKYETMRCNSVENFHHLKRLKKQIEQKNYKIN